MGRGNSEADTRELYCWLGKQGSKLCKEISISWYMYIIIIMCIFESIIMEKAVKSAINRLKGHALLASMGVFIIIRMVRRYGVYY